jgi:SAM-dependent methyltransferase
MPSSSATVKRVVSGFEYAHSATRLGGLYWPPPQADVNDFRTITHDEARALLANPEPSAWLIENADLWPRGGKVLDVACGRGRHALLLASAGFDVHAIDRDPDAIELLQSTAGRLRVSLSCEVVDLETDPPPALPGPCDAILVFNYLHRPLLPALCAALAPGGRLFYETFTTQQAARGHPTNPAFLLRAGELPALVAPLAVIRSREGEFDGRFVASVVAERRR